MKIGVFITARLGSERLKEKHMLKVNERPILEYLIQRINFEFKKELEEHDCKIIITTSDEPENRRLEVFNAHGCKLFYGSVHNIPQRHLEAMAYYQLDAAVSVDGDDILCSPKGMRSVYEELKKGTAYACTEGLPFGMNACGYAHEFLMDSLKGLNSKSLETGWGRIFDLSKQRKIGFEYPYDISLLRVTLDYTEDFMFFEKLILGNKSEIDRVTDEQLICYMITNKLYEINASVQEEYWRNFHQGKQDEINQSMTL